MSSSAIELLDDPKQGFVLISFAWSSIRTLLNGIWMLDHPKYKHLAAVSFGNDQVLLCSFEIRPQLGLPSFHRNHSLVVL